MPEATSLADATDALTAGRRPWIDVLLVVAGLTLVATGWPAIGAPVAILGAVTPVLRWTRGRRGGDIYHLVPTDLAASHRGVLAAARLPGVPDGPAVVEAADDALLEVAALLAGRPPRGAAQHRFVDAREKAMRDAAVEMSEWHVAYTSAKAELEFLDPVAPAPGPARPRTGLLVGGLAAVLLPAFVVWDGMALSGRGVVALLDGIALRVRTAGRVVVWAACGAAGVAGAARRAWNDARAVLGAAMVEARHRSSALRVQVRLRLRLARRVRHSA